MQKIALVRHGETSWSLTGRHTGKTDVPLTERGEEQAKLLKPLLKKFTFEKAFISPLQRTKKTFFLSELNVDPHWDQDLYEWDYGMYEGLTSSQIHDMDPSWSLFTQGAPSGESLEDVAARADRMLAKVKKCSRDVVLFSSGHFLRVLASRFIGFPPTFGKHLVISTATFSLLGYEHNNPTILLWNNSPI